MIPPPDSSLKSELRDALDRFGDLVSTRDVRVLAEFAPDGEVLLVGSEEAEIARGRPQSHAFFARIFARETAFSQNRDRVDVSHVGNVAWLLAEGRVIQRAGTMESGKPYRLAGVLEQRDGRP